ncbi:cobalamin adenosyltransferase [Isobaculum melis]|uniref:Ethanolamine utilization cobalamin adenosyltransferase n=1 Tax=Isobaculum melis TaxID=142588 RepID=A0A1H9U4J7_9LACT|nr:cobalamin adenosyltransferase [Isobaculum melis]SES04356.1 ethanolamine utilization cobalamin adenosyltransferase [Isobaculum melis]
MAILTEETVRRMMKTTEMQKNKVCEVKKGTIITPSARGFLSDHQIKLHEIPECEISGKLAPEKEAKQTENQTSQAVKMPFLYKTLDGGQFIEKPIYMRILKENIIVPLDHPQMKLRSQFDAVHGEVLKVQLLASEAGFTGLIEELELIANSSQTMGFNDVNLLSRLTNQKEDEQVTFQIQYQMGPIVIALNQLRLMIEQTSLLAYESLKTADGTVKECELLEGLDYLAHFCLKLMNQVNKGKYKKS